MGEARVRVEPGAELPALVITGASGFLGRHLIAALRERYRLFCLARRSQHLVGVPRHKNLRWFQVDIGDEDPLARVFRDLQGLRAPRYVIHLAAYYDFTGESHPEYLRTNVLGLRNLLEQCKAFHPTRFVFASSVAASAFPPEGSVLTETSPADGDHLYAITKRRGEQMVKEYQGHFPSTVVRLGALFSDWCEYPPLYFFLRTWLSDAWNSRVLGGKGRSAIPYLHVRDAVAFFAHLLEIDESLAPGETLIASTDEAISHQEIFEAATLAWHGHRVQPRFTPRPLARLGLRFFEMGGRWLAERPFERVWMGKYIDLRMPVDGSHTRHRTGWAPRSRRFLLRRIPFLVENLKTDPLEWHQRNLAALKIIRVEPNLHLYQLLEAYQERILVASMEIFRDPEGGALLPTYRGLPIDELRWAKQQLFLHLRNAVRTRERAIFREYCRHLAERRRAQGFTCEELCRALETERELVLHIVRSDPRAQALEAAIHDFVIGTFLVGIDEIEDTYEELEGTVAPPGAA